MGLRLGLGMWLADVLAFESQPIAGIGAGIDMADVSDRLLCQLVDGNGTLGAFVANMIGNDPAKSSAKRRPDYSALLFF